MKTILITSDLTYAPQNYIDVLEFVLNNSRKHIAGVALIKINLLNVFGKVLFLYFSGCKNIATTLARNIVKTLSMEKNILLKKYNVPFVETRSVNNHKALSWIQQIRPDLILNMRARCIYKDRLLKIPRLGCVNVHHGILPQQRGLFCDLYSLAENRNTGFTIHKMTNQLDRGKILYQESIKGNKNYLSYLAETSSKEKVAITNFINKVGQNYFLLGDRLNRCDNPVITTTPDFQTIKQLQRKGIIL